MIYYMECVSLDEIVMINGDWNYFLVDDLFELTEVSVCSERLLHANTQGENVPCNVSYAPFLSSWYSEAVLLFWSLRTRVDARKSQDDMGRDYQGYAKVCAYRGEKSEKSIQ